MTLSAGLNKLQACLEHTQPTCTAHARPTCTAPALFVALFAREA